MTSFLYLSRLWRRRKWWIWKTRNQSFPLTRKIPFAILNFRHRKSLSTNFTFRKPGFLWIMKIIPVIHIFILFFLFSVWRWSALCLRDLRIDRSVKNRKLPNSAESRSCIMNFWLRKIKHMLNIHETPFTGYAFSSTYNQQTGISSRYLKYHFFLRAEYRTTTGIQQFSTFRFIHCPEASYT